MAIARARDARWRSPPESVAGKRARSGSISRIATASSKTPSAAARAHAEADVPAHVEVRKEAGVLGDVADAAPLGREAHAARRVEQTIAVEQDAAVGGAQARDGLQKRRLAGARRAEHRDGIGVELRRDLERERREGEREVELDHPTDPETRLCFRLRISEARTAAKARTTVTQTSRIASASCPI